MTMANIKTLVAVPQPESAFIDDEAMRIAEHAITSIRTVNTTFLHSSELLVREACVAAYNAGRRHAEDEANLIAATVDTINDRRVQRFVHAAVLGAMDAANLSELRIDLHRQAAIFDVATLRMHTEKSNNTVVFVRELRAPGG